MAASKSDAIFSRSNCKLKIKNKLLEIQKSSIAYLKDNNLKVFLKIQSLNRVNRGKTKLQKSGYFLNATL